MKKGNMKKENMKKENIIRMMTVAGMALILSACTQEETKVKVPSITLPVSGVSETDTSNADTSNSDTSHTNASDTGDLEGTTDVSVKVTTLNKSYVGEFNGKEETLLNHVVHQVHLVSGNEQVAKLLEEENEETAAYYKTSVLSTLEREAPAYFSEREFEYTAAMEYTTQFRRADSRVLSMYWIDYGYLGGVHPYTMVSSDNYDMQTGKKLEFTDVVTDIESFAKTAIEEIANSEEYGQNYKAGAYDENLDESTYTYLKEGSLAWTITKEGIELWYADYMSGAYASGHITILIPYATHKELMNGKFFEKVEDYDVTSRVSVDRAQPEKIDAFDFCMAEDGVLLFNYLSISGIYRGEDGSTLEINEAGYFVCQKEDANDSYYVSGELRAFIGGFYLYSDYYDENTQTYETQKVGEFIGEENGLSGGLYQNQKQMYTLVK